MNFVLQGTIVELTAQIHTVLNSIEELYRNGEFNGSQQQYFEIVEICAKKRPVSDTIYTLYLICNAKEDLII